MTIDPRTVLVVIASALGGLVLGTSLTLGAAWLVSAALL